MSTYTYTGTAEQKRLQALGNMLNEGVDAVPTIASANEQAVRDALLAEVAGLLSGGPSTDYISLGASPPTTGAIRIDVSSYSNNALVTKGGTAYIGTSDTANLIFIYGGSSRWRVSGAAGTSTFLSEQATAQIVGGSSNGLAIRNSGNTRDNFRMYDSGGQVDVFDGTNTWTLAYTAGAGELPAGFYQSASGGVSMRAGPSQKASLVYYNGTANYSAAEVAAVGAGFSSLDLMKSGGLVTIQSGVATPAAGAATGPALKFGSAGIGIFIGSGAPTFSAAQGTLYLRSDGSSTSTRLYVNTNGTTGWTAITTAT